MECNTCPSEISEEEKPERYVYSTPDGRDFNFCPECTERYQLPDLTVDGLEALLWYHQIREVARETNFWVAVDWMATQTHRLQGTPYQQAMVMALFEEVKA